MGLASSRLTVLKLPPQRTIFIMDYMPRCPCGVVLTDLRTQEELRKWAHVVPQRMPEIAKRWSRVQNLAWCRVSGLSRKYTSATSFARKRVKLVAAPRIYKCYKFYTQPCKTCSTCIKLVVKLARKRVKLVNLVVTKRKSEHSSL